MNLENKMLGYKQLVDALIERYELTPENAIELLDRCLFDYDVIVSILNRAEELQTEELLK